MQIITIPDLHGKDCWKEINFDNYDKAIFLGDYVDPKDPSLISSVAENLLELIVLKLENPDKLELLLGNHDIQYMFYPHYRCSNLAEEIQELLTTIFNKYQTLFKFACQINNHLWTHAGVSNSWFSEHKEFFANFTKNDPYKDLSQIFNNQEKENLAILTEISPIRGGNKLFGGPLWADIHETKFDYLKGFHQYTGHNQVKEIYHIGNENESIRYLDCLNLKTTFFVISIDC